MRCKTTGVGLLACTVVFFAVPAFTAPWWDGFPRMVDTAWYGPSLVSSYHGNFAMNGCGTDPAWGTFFQADALRIQSSNIAAFEAAGIKQIYYSETYGQSVAIVSELGAWDETSLTPVLHHYWNWNNYGGGTIRWLGAKNFFDDEVYARPFTRTHPRYGGPAMTYPDGAVATGYDGSDTDPRNSRVYDAGCSKNIFGEINADYGLPPAGSPTNGLVHIDGVGYVGHMSLDKDSACPHWNDYTYASVLQAADAGADGMWTDNYGPWDSFGNPPVRRGFGDWSVARFRDYLADNYNILDLVVMGVPGGNTATFNIRTYLLDKVDDFDGPGNPAASDLNHSAWSDAGWANVPLWRAYSIFKRQTGTEALSNYYSSVKAAAFEGGKDEFLVAGNDIPGFSLGWCRGDLDMVSTEMGMGWQLSQGPTGFTPPPAGRYAPFYKLAREHAKSRFVNVWLYNDGYETELSNIELANVMYYEMLATHTLPRYEPTNERITGYAGDGPANNAAFFEFVEQAAPVFGGRVPVEDVGIYYSSSSILRRFTPGGYENHASQPHQFGFWGWGTALGELHYQYRAVPEWKLTAETLAGLRVLVIPNADVLDPADVDGILVPWVDSGGRLIITGNTGTYLGESGNFDEPGSGATSVDALKTHPNVVYLSGNIGLNYYLASGSRPALLPQFSSAMNTALAGVADAGVTDTTATGTTGITLYEDEATERFFIDVNNFNINNTTYAMTGTGTITIEALLPEAMRGKTLYASVVSPQSTTPTVTLLTPSEANHVKISLGSVEYYAGVVISTANHAWADPATSGSWDTASNWMPESVPATGHSVLWRYGTNNPTITVSAPAEVTTFTAYRNDDSISYWNNVEGLKVVKQGSDNGSLVVGGGAGVLDMWDGGWFGSRLTVVNENAAAAADVIDAGEIKVRDFVLETANIVSRKSYFTHEEGDLDVQVQIELGGPSGLLGGEAVFRQSGGTIQVEHDTYGLQIGYGALSIKGAFMLDGGTCSISTITFAQSNSRFEFNDGTFSNGARDVLWKSWDQVTSAGALQLAGTGTHEFNVEVGRTMTIDAEVELADKPGEKGTLTKTGAGTLRLDTDSSNSGSMDVQEGVLSLSTTGLDAELQLLVDPAALVELDYAGTNAISALSFDGGGTWADTGVWGATGSGAEHESSRFSGTGLVRVLGLVPPAAWAEIYFTEGEIAAGLSTGTLDPDIDGMDNLFEFAIGGNPMASDATNVLPVAEFNADLLRYVYNRRLGAASLGLSYNPVYKFDLTSTNGWIPFDLAWETGSAPIDPDFETVTNEVDVSGVDQAFIRLEVTAE